MSMTLISTVTVGAGGTAQIDFNSIPQTFTDLLFVASLRGNDTSGGVYLGFNGDGTGFSERFLRGTGSAAQSGTSSQSVGRQNLSSSTASTFGSLQMYIPNYTSSANKTFSVDFVTENNAAAALQEIRAGVWSNTAAISSVLFVCDSTFAQHSSISLYGITKGSGGATVS